jgi:small subunit ribosomal protein YMR-31
MNATRILQQGRQPMIRFIGKRSIPSSTQPSATRHIPYPLTLPVEVDHTPHVHPASPTQHLPDSFASYRKKAQQHGPLNQSQNFSGIVGGHVGGAPGASLGRVEAAKGQYFDRSELPARFQRLSWSAVEMEAIESGGASLFA